MRPTSRGKLATILCACSVGSLGMLTMSGGSIAGADEGKVPMAEAAALMPQLVVRESTGPVPA